MNAVHKLIRQIRDALSKQDQNAPLESLAADYARLCHEANQRLDSCTAMLEKGSEYQALQLAETEPALLDLIATLSFAEAPEWAAFCVENQLAVAAKCDPKAVQALDGLYARGINANHPLYKDYRAAVTSRDDGKAIQIIRSIVRLNPDDANGKSELARLENKLFQLRLQALRTALAGQDENATLAELSELERLATPAKLSELPEFVRASEVRREAARRDAIALSERLVESLDEEHKAGAWRMVGDILARLRSLQSEHKFSLTTDQATKVAEMQRYFDTQRAAADEATGFANAIFTIGGLSESLDSRLLTRSTLTLGEAENLQAQFNLHWKEVEKYQRPVPEELVRRVRASAGALRAETERMQRQKRLKIVSASVIGIIIITVAAWFVILALRAQDYSVQLARLRSAGQVEAAEKMIAQLRKEEAQLTTKPKLRASMDEVDGWARSERSKLADAEGRLTELEGILKQGVPDAAMIDFSTKLELTKQLIETTAGSLRAGPEGRMLVVRNQFEAYVTTLRDKLATQSDGELALLEDVAGAKLGYDQPKEVLTAALTEIEPRLKSLEARVKPALAALELPSSQQGRVSALRKRTELFQDELATLAKVHEASIQATTLDAYVQALGGYKSSRLAQTPEVNDARKLLAAFPKTDDLFASLLMPNDPVGWAAAKADVSGEAFAPDTVLPGEIQGLLRLRDNNYINDIWEVTFIDFHRKSERRELYSRGDLKKETSAVNGIQTTRWEGKVYDPASKYEIPAFIPSTFTMARNGGATSGDGDVSATRLSGPSKCISDLELNRMTDAAGSKFEKPLLRVFDDLIREKSANSIFKAYLMQELAAVLKTRPYAWGLEYCESLRNDLAELDRICDGLKLQSQDWLLERKKAQLGPKLTAYFTGLQKRSYLAEARLHREVVLRVLKAGLQFGGFNDSSGQEHLLGEARSSKSLWALATDGQTLVRYVAASGTQGEKPSVASFSPIFFVPLDRDSLLAEIGRKGSAQSAPPAKLPAIPWLQNP